MQNGAHTFLASIVSSGCVVNRKKNLCWWLFLCTIKSLTKAHFEHTTLSVSVKGWWIHARMRKLNECRVQAVVQCCAAEGIVRQNQRLFLGETAFDADLHNAVQKTDVLSKNSPHWIDCLSWMSSNIWTVNGHFSTPPTPGWQFKLHNPLGLWDLTHLKHLKKLNILLVVSVKCFAGQVYWWQTETFINLLLWEQ